MDRQQTIASLERKAADALFRLKAQVILLPTEREAHIERVNKAFDFLDANKNGENYLIKGKEAIVFHDFEFPKVTLLFRPVYSHDDIGSGAGMSLIIEF